MSKKAKEETPEVEGFDEAKYITLAAIGQIESGKTTIVVRVRQYDKGVPRVKGAVGVRRRHNDREGLLMPRGQIIGIEKTAFLPFLINRPFLRLRLIRGQKFIHKLIILRSFL